MPEAGWGWKNVGRGLVPRRGRGRAWRMRLNRSGARGHRGMCRRRNVRAYTRSRYRQARRKLPSGHSSFRRRPESSGSGDGKNVGRGHCRHPIWPSGRVAGHELYAPESGPEPVRRGMRSKETCASNAIWMSSARRELRPRSSFPRRRESRGAVGKSGKPSRHRARDLNAIPMSPAWPGVHSPSPPREPVPGPIIQCN